MNVLKKYAAIKLIKGKLGIGNSSIKATNAKAAMVLSTLKTMDFIVKGCGGFDCVSSKLIFSIVFLIISAELIDNPDIIIANIGIGAKNRIKKGNNIGSRTKVMNVGILPPVSQALS